MWNIRNVLIPHLTASKKSTKPKPGLIYFMDINNHFSEEEYVKILLGIYPPTRSSYYKQDDLNTFKKCLIEDCAHSNILKVKTQSVKVSFNVTILATLLTFLSVALVSILYVIGV